ncbi:MAG: RidA family protein [Candidatus Sumerlaeia bacterium]|nr:RidA family protein [Candidatus Sumerlaeia bacterium]
MPERLHHGTGTAWEARVGYSRAVRAGNWIAVAGTCAIGPDGRAVAPGDGGAQARFVFARIEEALRALGSSLGDVVRTRMYITDLRHAEAVGAAHGELFRAVRPASTMLVVAGLVDPELVVEIEVDALAGE